MLNYFLGKTIGAVAQNCAGLTLMVLASNANARIGSHEFEPFPMPGVVERMESGDTTMLVRDGDRSRAKLIKCMKIRTPDFPMGSMEEFAREAQAKFLRIVGDILYVPALFLRTPCEDAGMQEFMDKLDIPNFTRQLAPENQR